MLVDREAKLKSGTECFNSRLLMEDAKEAGGHLQEKLYQVIQAYTAQFPSCPMTLRLWPMENMAYSPVIV